MKDPLRLAFPNLDDAAFHLSRFCLPLGIKSRRDNSPLAGAKRATATLLRLQERDVFVTCWHVIEEFRQTQKLDPSAELVGYAVDAEELIELNGFSLIDQEKSSLDVAILRRMEDRIEIGRRLFLEYPASYASDPRVGEPILVVGYPGANVKIRQFSADFGIFYMGLRASSVSERQIVLANEDGSRVFRDVDDPAAESVNLGGLSGSPAFLIRDGRASFVGVLTNCSEMANSTTEMVHGEVGKSLKCTEQTILISRLGAITRDGKLDHSLIPW